MIVRPEARLIVRAPKHISLAYIENLIAQKSVWIKRKIEEILNRAKVQETEFTDQEILFYNEKALKLFKERGAYYSNLTGLFPRSIKISNARKRWESCSRTGNINLSWRLVLKPLAVIDYVIVHELAHLKHLNHSRKYWDYVGSVVPDYKVQRKWLKNN